MFETFFPNLVVNGIYDIDLVSLKKKNIKGLILDIDNTLVPNYVKEVDEKLLNWIENVRKSDFKICIVSNAAYNRVQKINEKLKVNAIHRAVKPFKKSFKKALNLLELDSQDVAVIGDQIFTDIYGGNRMKMYTILVSPMDNKKEFILVRMKRLPEKFILKQYKKY